MSNASAGQQLEQALDGVSSTLLIPLAARAFGDAMFPTLAIHDAYAAAVLRRLKIGVGHFLEDPASVYGVLSRTRIFCELAHGFFDRYPRALGVNLGCGLACYFQWLDRRSNRWFDADVPCVMALRKRLLPAGGKRLGHAEVDLRRPGWWHQLGLPRRRDGSPVLLICEGVLMYLEAEEVQCLLHEFGEHAPAGSELLCDTLCWLAVGRAAMHPSVRHTPAQFRWGLRRMTELTEPHPRLVLRSEHAVMDAYDFFSSLACPTFRALYGVPLYGVVRLGVSG